MELLGALSLYLPLYLLWLHLPRLHLLWLHLPRLHVHLTRCARRRARISISSWEMRRRRPTCCSGGWPRRHTRRRRGRRRRRHSWLSITPGYPHHHPHPHPSPHPNQAAQLGEHKAALAWAMGELVHEAQARYLVITPMAMGELVHEAQALVSSVSERLLPTHYLLPPTYSTTHYLRPTTHYSLLTTPYLLLRTY